MYIRLLEKTSLLCIRACWRTIGFSVYLALSEFCAKRLANLFQFKNIHSFVHTSLFIFHNKKIIFIFNNNQFTNTTTLEGTKTLLFQLYR